jgi:signal transduction histidine kinase
MKGSKKRLRKSEVWRGLTVQLFAVTVLPLTLLLLVIAFASVALHERDMRSLVGERDERAVRSAAAALEAELHHRRATISSLGLLANSSEAEFLDELSGSGTELGSDFDGGLALLDPNGHLLADSPRIGPWAWIARNPQYLPLASSKDPNPDFSAVIVDPDSSAAFVVMSAYSASQDVILAGAFSPDALAREILSASYPPDGQVTIYLLDSSGRLLFVSDMLASESLAPDHPGVAEARSGKSGTVYYQKDGAEHVVAYSPIPIAGWALITEEAWESVISPSLQLTQMAPLVLVPVFILALVALWFGARQIVQPLQRLESKAAALAWGDFETIQEPVGGISEVQHLQMELVDMSRKVRAAQEGLHDYIGAITAAQEEERLRLARELHDETIQAVIALKQRVQLAQRSIKDHSALRTLSDLEKLAEQTIENLRRMTRALRPIYLEDLGLVTALEMLARETIQDNSLQVGFEKRGEERRLLPDVELALYRIAQEALNNVVRHAQASHAHLQMTFADQGIKLDLTDDGIGFQVPNSPTEFASAGHYGLLGMRERAELIGARLELESAPGRGTRLRVHV